MSLPSSSNSQDPSNPSSPKSTARHARVQQSAWGPISHQSGPRRGLTPLSTGQPSSQARSGTSSPSRNVLSPTISAFNPPSVAASKQVSSRHSSISSASSLFSPLASVAQPNIQNRSRNTTSSGSPRLGSSASGAFAPLDRGGGGGGSSNIGGSRLARHSPSLSSTAGSPTLTSAPQSGGSGGQLTSLVITQLNILLSTIKEVQDRTKWELQADKIWKLVDAHGMEVFTQYFRRLVQSNASQIFSGPSRANDGAGGSYQLLVNEIQKLATDPDQALKIAESLDTTDGDLFKDFDLATFTDHFRLNPIIRTSLTLACKSIASKSDLKTKAEADLSSNLDLFLSTLSEPTDIHDNIPPLILASIIERLIHNPPRTWNEDKKSTLQYAVRLRYNRLNTSMPYAVGAALSLLDLCSTHNTLIRLLQQAGPKATYNLDTFKDLIARTDASAMGYHQVADTLLYMAISESGDRYDLSTFVAAIRQHRSGQRLDWQDVTSAFDRPDLRLTKSQFLSLYNALLPVAKEVESFDIQSLWGGTWSNSDAQLSFVVALLSTSPAELDISQVPKLRTAFSMDEFSETSEDIKEHAAKAVAHPMVSYEATQALFTIIFSSQEAYNSAQSLGIPEAVINANTDVFVCAASAVLKPWTALQEQALKQLFYPFFTRALPNHSFVMHSLWMHDKTWLAARFIEHYNNNPKVLSLIFEHASEHSWTDVLTGVRNDFGLDFTALAHSHGLVDLEKWSQDHTDANKVPAMELSRAIISFLRFKIEDELALQRENGAAGSTVPLKVKTVFALLNVIQGTVTEQEEGAIQRQCIQAYPRLINYGYTFDHIIDANGENGNALSEDADAKMQEQYKDMYSGDADARKMINTLRSLRVSEEPADQELFACMIHGLFDEYNCFGEYPLEALATTAVLFGGIINFGILHSRITLSVALFMVVDAVAGYTPEDSMYKFGLQASLHFIGRLEEWPQLCERLCRIPGLRGTEVYTKAEEIVKRQAGTQVEDTRGDVPLTNGEGAGFDLDSAHQPFASINPDPPLRPSMYEEPDEETSDKVTFVLNNVSKRNIEEKFKELQGHLEERFHQWFAAYLVENLAKSQPNFQTLYLQLLSLFDRNILWLEVIRETYVSIARIINAEATLNNSTDRNNLKNLAVWLGLLTLARDRPILHRNISFRDLLIEAHQSQRLLIALPFTCKTLAQAAQSSIFKPPNPWTMELIGLMMELYHFAELKLNLKFEIEVLCKEMGLDHKNLEPLDIIRSLPMAAEESFLQPYAPETMDGFGDMLGLSKRSNERLSAQEVMKSLPDLSTLLTFPPAPGNVSQQQIKNVFLTAAQRAIQEIIAPVVDRSVTIAAISTSQLVEKDFAMEPDTERLQQASYNVVKALSGSLALVTCKEPLRMSIMNNIRLLAAQHLPDQLPEGSILMFLNDNLDTVCKLVEDSAESHSLAEIDAQLEHAIDARQRHRQQRPREPFNDPPVSRWAFFVPEPYRQEQGGLNQHQLAIYEEFGRHMRVPPASHTNNASQDSSRQIQDVLSEGYLPNMPTPAEAPALPRQAVQQQPRMQPPAQQGVHGQVNGYVDMQNIAERMQALIDELHHTAREAPEEHIRDLAANSPTREIYEQLVHLIDASLQKDNLALMAGQRATVLVFTEAKTRLEVEVLIQFLNQLCALSAPTARQLILYLTSLDDDRIFNAVVVVCLLKSLLIDLHHVDTLVTKAMNQRRQIVLDFFAELMDELLQTEQPGPLRADFSQSFIALGQWSLADENNDKTKEILNKLNHTGPVPDGIPTPDAALDKQDQLEYVFDEWISLQRPDVSEIILATFIQQLHSRSIFTNKEDHAMLVRIACDLSVDGYEREAAISGNIDHAYVNVDATAKLIAALVAFQQEDASDQRSVRTALLEELLCYVVLTFNHHYTTRQERFNSKVFFRLFSTMFAEFHGFGYRLDDINEDVPVKLGSALLAMQPELFPGFAFHWITLIGHRMLVVRLLLDAPQHISAHGEKEMKGWDVYTRLVCAALSYLGDLKDVIDTSTAAQDLYRATLRVLCVIQHDYPEFLAENHLFLNGAIADNMVQLYNVINCANPSTVQELPDPFTPGLKINRLDQVRQNPTVRADIDDILDKAGLKALVDRLMGAQNKEISASDVGEVTRILVSAPYVSEIYTSKASQQAVLVNALMIYLGNVATIASSTFSSSAPQAKILERLVADANPALRYVVISAMANQIRYPSSHTHYFSTAMLHLFTTASEDVQQQLARVLVERLLVSRPHPWGLIVTILELIKNQRYNIFEQRWMKAAPEVERMLLTIAQTQGYGGSPAR
ncbi:Not1-domain-containing protein [Myriangium duriaei CBS 260.36]|uniref:General negative regulator of transcription subunit 1 n=1 Tax=Myriangium duriaei CBS 260.36 TaxID=1168546 RepID=A0A9P4J2V0_9PEZI|nr:Not1-domain-containing protein [Myriangium duriaei CBS 260.36]